MKYSIAIVGPESNTSLFKSVGAKVFPAHTGSEALEQLTELRARTIDPESTEKYAVVLVLEELYQNIPEQELTKLSKGSLPSIVAIPGPQGSSGAALKKLKRLAEQAVGSDILS